MKKLILLTFIAVSSFFAFSQTAKMAAPAQFTKAELLAFTDVKALLAAINKQDYSKYLVRNFKLTTVITNADKTTTTLTEMGPGGAWSEKQKAMVEKYAQKGAAFTLENIVIIEGGKKGVINQPSVSFSIKE